MGERDAGGRAVGLTAAARPDESVALRVPVDSRVQTYPWWYSPLPLVVLTTTLVVLTTTPGGTHHYPWWYSPLPRGTHHYPWWYSPRIRHEPPAWRNIPRGTAHTALDGSFGATSAEHCRAVRRTLPARCVADSTPSSRSTPRRTGCRTAGAGGGKRARPLGAAQSSAATIWRDMRRSRPSHAAALPPAHKSPPNRGSPRLHWPQ